MFNIYNSFEILSIDITTYCKLFNRIISFEESIQLPDVLTSLQSKYFQSRHIITLLDYSSPSFKVKARASTSKIWYQRYLHYFHEFSECFLRISLLAFRPSFMALQYEFFMKSSLFILWSKHEWTRHLCAFQNCRFMIWRTICQFK